jgi:hypothetical protein
MSEEINKDSQEVFNIRFKGLHKSNSTTYKFPNKVYVVVGTFSDWDDYSERNLKAFIKKECAENYVEKANRVLGAMSKHIKKLQNLQRLDKPEYDGLSVEEILDRQDKLEETVEFKLALKIWGCHWKLRDFNECKIQEIELR